MNRLLALLIIIVSSFGGFYANRWFSASDAERYIPRRIWILEQAALRAAAGHVLLVGDSLAERSGMVTLCGHPVFNAGVSAAALGQIAPAAAGLARDLKPVLTVIAVGTNDVRLGTDIVTWSAQYRTLAAKLPKPLVIVAIPHVQNGAPFPDSAIVPYNAELEKIARDMGARFVPAMSFPTVDGVHQTAQGAQIWRGNLDQVCGLPAAPVASVAPPGGTG